MKTETSLKKLTESDKEAIMILETAIGYIKGTHLVPNSNNCDSIAKAVEACAGGVLVIKQRRKEAEKNEDDQKTYPLLSFLYLFFYSSFSARKALKRWKRWNRTVDTTETENEMRRQLDAVPYVWRQKTSIR